MLMTKSTGLETNMVEIKTWQFSYGGVVVVGLGNNRASGVLSLISDY